MYFSSVKCYQKHFFGSKNEEFVVYDPFPESIDDSGGSASEKKVIVRKE